MGLVTDDQEHSGTETSTTVLEQDTSGEEPGGKSGERGREDDVLALTVEQSTLPARSAKDIS